MTGADVNWMRLWTNVQLFHLISLHKCREIQCSKSLGRKTQVDFQISFLFHSVLLIISTFIVAVGSDELDSYMYQTVGHHAIDLYAEAMALPLYRRTIRGRSVDTGRVYTKCEGDEVEDLYELLKLVKVCPVTNCIN